MSLIMRCTECGEPLRASMRTPIEIKKVGTCACRKCSGDGGESIRDWYVSGVADDKSTFDEIPSQPVETSQTPHGQRWKLVR